MWTSSLVKNIGTMIIKCKAKVTLYTFVDDQNNNRFSDKHHWSH